MALWSGRFTENVSEFTQRFGASLPVDKALYAQDIAGSQAHARMLASAGVIEPADAEAIVEGLDRVKARIEAGDFAFDINDEDIHMSVERALIADIGDAGARLHTGRSRNDQVATDTRLFAKQRCEDLMAANVALRQALVRQAKAHFESPSCPATRTCSTPSRCCSRTICWPTCGCSRATSSAWRPRARRPTRARWVRRRSRAPRTRSIGR